MQSLKIIELPLPDVKVDGGYYKLEKRPNLEEAGKLVNDKLIRRLISLKEVKGIQYIFEDKDDDGDEYELTIKSAIVTYVTDE